MLFDLQDPRRRAAIKVIYGTLAVLMGGGLIFFGIGSDAQGGLSEIFGGGSSSGFEDQIEDAESQTEETPRDPEAWLELASLQLQQGNQQLETDEETLQTSLTSDAEESYSQAAEAWNRYLRLKPPKPDSGIALLLANSYVVLAQNASSASEADIALTNAAEAQQIAAEENPIVGNLKNLSLYLYYSGQFAAGDRVAAQAIAKSPTNAKASTRQQLEQAEKQARAFQKQLQAAAKGEGAGGNPLEEPGALGGGSALGGGALAAP